MIETRRPPSDPRDPGAGPRDTPPSGPVSTPRGPARGASARATSGLDLLTPRLLAEHQPAVATLVARAKRIGGVLSLVVMAAYVAAGLALWRLDGSAGVWTALLIATLAFLFFRQLPAVALAFARMPERGRPEQAALQRAIDLALDRQPARDVLRRLDAAAAREPGRRRAQ